MIILAYSIILVVIFSTIGAIVFWDDIRKELKPKCKVCGGKGYHKLSCPNNKDGRVNIYVEMI